MTPGMDLYIVDEQPKELDADSNPEERKAYRDWHNSNRKAKTLIRTTMIDSIRRSIEEPDTTWDFLQAISEKYLENGMAEILRLNREYNDMSFSVNGSVREHIMTMMDLNSRLKDLEVGVKDEQVVAQALESLAATYSNLKTTYNAYEEKWTLNKLISVCVNEEARIRESKKYEPTTTVNLVEKEKAKWKNYHKLKAKKTVSTKVSGKSSEAKAGKTFKYKCFFCKKPGHIKRDCSGFKAWMAKKGYNKEESPKEK